MSNLIGKKLNNRYQVTDFIGRGGMAEVYKVWDQHRCIYLALKLLLEDLATDRVFMRRFRREAANLEKLHHPNIVRFYGIEEYDSFVYMLLNFIEGKTLKRFIYDFDSSLNDNQVGLVSRGICTALQFAHNEGFVHCDVKPSNIMINQQGNVLLADFGIARMAEVATATMVGCGTPAYMAPEQIDGKSPVPQTDIYAFGVVLYEMLTGGERPFTGEEADIDGTTGDKIRWEHINMEPPPLSKWNSEISPKVEGVVLRCLAKNYHDRFDSALTLYNAIEGALTTGAMDEVENSLIFTSSEDNEETKTVSSIRKWSRGR